MLLVFVAGANNWFFPYKNYLNEKTYVFSISKMPAKKRSQAAMEYLIIVFISLIMISGFTYYFFAQKTTYEEEAMSAKVDSIGSKLALYAEEAHYSTGPYRKTIHAHMPEAVERMYIHDENYIVFTTKDNRTFVHESDVPVYGFVEKSKIHSGKFVIENVNDKAVVCSSGPCACMDNETGYCDDLADNDCDGLVDGADYPDCCPDNDNDSYADIDYRGVEPSWCQPPDTFASDCNRTRADINPGHIEICDDIDHDCDDSIRNTACQFKCYLENNPLANGLNNCTRGYFNLLQMENTTNAHVEEPGGSNGYEYDLCCQRREKRAVNLSCKLRNSNTCPASESKVMGLSADGFHGEKPSLTALPNSLCCNVSNTAGTLDCNITISGASCQSNETGIVSMSYPENSHLAKYGEYPYNICCIVDP